MKNAALSCLLLLMLGFSMAAIRRKNTTNFFTDTLQFDFVKCLDPCRYPPLIMGPCHKQVLRWTYIANWNLCKLFVYGGCLGNKNNFDSIDSCRATCKYM